MQWSKTVWGHPMSSKSYAYRVQYRCRPRSWCGFTPPGSTRSTGRPGPGRDGRRARRPAVHPGLGCLRSRRGGRLRRHAPSRSATRSSGCRGSRGRGGLRRVRHRAGPPVRPQAADAEPRAGGGGSVGRADRLADPRRHRRGRPGQRVLVHAAAGGVGTSPCSSPSTSVQRDRHGERSPSRVADRSSAPTSSSTTPPPGSRRASPTSTWWSIWSATHARHQHPLLVSSPPRRTAGRRPRRRITGLSTAAEAHGVRVSPFLVEPDGAALGHRPIIDQGGLSVDVQTFSPLARSPTPTVRRNRPHPREARTGRDQVTGKLTVDSDASGSGAVRRGD